MTSDLTSALNRILRWIQQHKPGYVEYLQPGLSIAEIEDLVRELPIQLSPEVYELYQWRNGARKGGWSQETAWLFENWTFKPLQEVVAEYQECLSRESLQKTYRVQPKPYFKIFNGFSIFYNIDPSKTGFIWLNKILNFCPVIFEYFDEGSLSILEKYTSLTSMMLTIAECYETGACYIDSEVYGGYFISRNPDKSHQIWRKYNSQIIDLAIQALQQGALSGLFFIYFSDDLIEFKDSRAVEPLIQALQSPIDQNEDPFDYINSTAEITKILGELGASQAVPALIAVLEDDYSYNCYYKTRVYAAKALGQLKDKRATYPLIRTLQDDHSEVRQMAAWALGELNQ